MLAFLASRTSVGVARTLANGRARKGEQVIIHRYLHTNKLAS